MKWKNWRNYKEIYNNTLQDAAIEWDSGLKVIDKIKVVIDYGVLLILNNIDKKVINNEFSVLFKGEFRESAWYVSPEYYIPKQEVSYASVKYIEDLAKYRHQGFNVVVHKHPGTTSFSSVDDKYVNSHFPVSLLYVNNQIVNAKVLVSIADNVKIRLPAEVILTFPEKEIENIENITEMHNYCQPYTYLNDLY